MRAVAVAAGAVGALVVLYLALGGASYEPAGVADPCAQREWRAAAGVEAVAEQIVLSALDGAACRLGTSREETVLAFASDDALRRFGATHHVSSAELERLVRSGLVRAIDDAQQADAIGSTTAGILRALATRIPVEQLIGVLDRLRALIS